MKITIKDTVEEIRAKLRRNSLLENVARLPLRDNVELQRRVREAWRGKTSLGVGHLP